MEHRLGSLAGASDQAQGNTAIRLRQLLLREGLSVTAFAARLGVTRQTIHRWLQGYPVSPANLGTVSRLFNVPVSWLQGDGAATEVAGGLLQQREEMALPLELTHLRERYLEAVMDSERRLNLGLALAGLAVWEFDLLNGSVHWSRNTLSVFGEDVSKEPWAQTLKRLPANDHARVQEALRRLSEEEDEAIENMRVMITWPDQSQHHLAFWARHERDHAGRPRSLVGAVQKLPTHTLPAFSPRTPAGETY